MIPCPRRIICVSEKHRVKNPLAAPARSDADEKQAGIEGGCFGGYSFMERQITGGPESCSLLQSAVAEESHHDLARAGDPEDLPERQRLSGICSFRRIYNFRSVFIYGSTGRRSRGGAGNIPGPPKRKAEKQDSCQGHLQDADIPVAGVPGGGRRKVLFP